MTETRYLSIAAVLLLTACAPVDGPSGDDHDDLPDTEGHEPAWSYDGLEGPSHWHELDVANEACGHLNTQSPIALPPAMPDDDLPDLAPDYRDTEVAVTNDGHTIRYDYDAGSTLRVGDARYELLQFHFHAHSEHTIGGAYKPMELHLVHRDAAGHYLVLGVFVEEGASNETLVQAGWDQLPTTADGSLHEPALRFSAAALIPGGPTYRYTGSLTTPPCTEGISWIVYERPITASAEQIRAFMAVYDHTYRPLQPLGTRDLVHGE